MDVAGVGSVVNYASGVVSEGDQWKVDQANSSTTTGSYVFLNRGLLRFVNYVRF